MAVSVEVSVPGPDPTSPLVGYSATGRGLTLQGTIEAVNGAMSTVRYVPDQDLNGPDELQFFVSDLGNVGSGGPLTNSTVVSISAIPVNDIPRLSGPSFFSVEEDSSILLNGIVLNDTDAYDGILNSTSEAEASALHWDVTLHVLAGTLTLPPSNSSGWIQGSTQVAGSNDSSVSPADSLQDQIAVSVADFNATGNGTARLSLSGSMAGLRLLASLIRFAPLPNSNRNRVNERISVTLSD